MILCIRKALHPCMSDKLLDLLHADITCKSQERSFPYIHIPKRFMTVTFWEPDIYHYRHLYKTEPKSKAKKGNSISYWLNIFWSQRRDE